MTAKDQISANQAVTELLKQQHEEVKAMFAQLEKADGEVRAQLFDCLRATLAVHETAEEVVVHPVARMLGGDEGNRVVDARVEEEAEAKKVLAHLEKLTPEGYGFGPKLLAFKQAVLAHAEAEEHELFPILEKRCDLDQLHQMAERVGAAERMAPTHPHPHGPHSAIGNVLVGPFVAMADKVRDKLAS